MMTGQFLAKRFVAAAVLAAGFVLPAAPPALAATEEEIGRDYHKQLSQQYKVYKDPRVTEIGRKVSEVAGVDDVEFFAIDMGKDDQPNAFQIPNHIYATKSLLRDFDDISLTFIMGHELGHQVGRHMVHQQRKNRNTGLLAVLASVVFGVRPNTAGDYAIALAHGAITNSYSREQEEEADLFGLEVIHDLGISFESAATAFEKLGGGRSENRTLNTLFGTHPVMKDRITRTGSASDWLSMRPVDIHRTQHGSVALIWQYTGDRPVTDAARNLRQEVNEALTSSGTEQRAVGDPPIWARLSRIDDLPADELVKLGGVLEVDWMLAALDVDRTDKGMAWKGFLINAETGERSEVEWKLDDRGSFPEKLTEAIRES